MVLRIRLDSSGTESISRCVAGSCIFAIGKIEVLSGFFFGSLKYSGLWN